MERVSDRVSGLFRHLPRGRSLPLEVWAKRHRGILIFLWAHVPGLFVYALVRGVGLRHAVLEAAMPAVFALGATMLRQERRWSTLAAVFGLLTASAVLVHLSGGVIETHFHFFVVVGILTLYQDWEPFLLGIGYVVVEHGLGGALIPDAVYNHGAAQRDPWTWAAVHGVFVLAMSAAGVASWRLNEILLRGIQAREQALADAQAVARLGSWEHDVRTGATRWSDELHRLTGVADVRALGASSMLAHIHPEDAPTVARVMAGHLDSGDGTSFDCRWLREDGSTLFLQVRAHVTERDEDGRPLAVAGTAQDISERVEADASIRAALSLLEATLDATADGILVTDLDGRVSTVNRRFLDMWRLPPELGVRGTPARDLVMSVLDQLTDPEGVIGRARVVQREVASDSHEMIEFTDGRVFERFSTPQRIGLDIVGRVWTCRDVTEHKRLQDELEHRAFHDALTGLANQSLMRALTGHALARLGRTAEPVAALFVDLDNFKTVNDSLGHTVGDELLVAVSRRLASCVRPADTTARLGGDEFAILIDEAASEADATGVAERIIEALRRPFHLSGKELYASASIGIAFGQVGMSVDQLLRNADLAMYTAKRRGRGRFEIYAPDMHEAALARLELEADLRGAVEREELFVVYQPIVDVHGGSVQGVEALVRWNHPERGPIGPDVFIPIAEESDLINRIGDLVLRAACRQTRQWQLDGATDLGVSVNLAPRQLLDAGIVERVATVLRETELPASSLMLEITEGAMVQDADLAIERLLGLKGLGVRLAVDDFGTGYSSLSYLHRFPIDTVKIDRSFVEQLAQGDESVASAILSMAHALKLTTIAEGVETADQAEMLERLGCDSAQGYHFARPALPADVPVRGSIAATIPETAPVRP